MREHEVLLAPVLSERASAATEKHNTVTFRVALTANKYVIRSAVEKAYQVKVHTVRTSVTKGKLKRRGQSIGRRPDKKKAMVKLEAGQSIDFFATE